MSGKLWRAWFLIFLSQYDVATLSIEEDHALFVNAGRSGTLAYNSFTLDFPAFTFNPLPIQPHVCQVASLLVP